MKIKEKYETPEVLLEHYVMTDDILTGDSDVTGGTGLNDGDTNENQG